VYGLQDDTTAADAAEQCKDEKDKAALETALEKANKARDVANKCHQYSI
jgi:hypothetical protein